LKWPINGTLARRKRAIATPNKFLLFPKLELGTLPWKLGPPEKYEAGISKSWVPYLKVKNRRSRSRRIH
jgi:hypothetical protein